MARHVRFAAASALAAAFSLPVMPAAAAPLPEAARGPVAYDASASAVHQAYGWRDSSRDGVYYPRGVGDDPRWAQPDDRRDYSDRQGYDYQAPQRDLGLDRVAELCVGVVERGRSQVDRVDGLSHDRDGWSVSGALYDGSGFTCRIGNDGQLQDLHFGRRGAVVPLSSGRDDLARPAQPAVQRGDNLATPALRTESGDQRNSLGTIPLLTPRADADRGDSSAAISEGAAQPQAQDSDNYAAAREPVPALSGAPAEQGPATGPTGPSPSAGKDQADNYAAARELPPQSAGAEESASSPALLAKPADPASSASEAAAPAPTDAGQADAPAGDARPASAVDDDEVLPPADTSEALPVDPDKSPPETKAVQPHDDGRYSTSQAPDFSQKV